MAQNNHPAAANLMSGEDWCWVSLKNITAQPGWSVWTVTLASFPDQQNQQIQATSRPMLFGHAYNWGQATQYHFLARDLIKANLLE